jgi:amidohydrolase
MLEEGVLDNAPVAAFALHVTPRWPAGTIATRPGPILASADAFSIVLRGRGGHASAPHLAADPVPVACEIVLALQSFITRTVSIFAPGVLTVANVEAGTTHNIIPETATLRGTVRALAPETREHIRQGIQRLARGLAEAHGLAAEIDFEPGYPVTVNNPDAARLALDVASFWGPVLTGATMAMIGAVTVLGLRARPLIPRWLTALGVIAFVEQAVETITVFGTDGFTAPGGDMNVLLGAGISALFLIGLTAWAVRRPGTPVAA